MCNVSKDGDTLLLQTCLNFLVTHFGNHIKVCPFWYVHLIIYTHKHTLSVCLLVCLFTDLFCSCDGHKTCWENAEVNYQCEVLFLQFFFSWKIISLPSVMFPIVLCYQGLPIHRVKVIPDKFKANRNSALVHSFLFKWFDFCHICQILSVNGAWGLMHFTAAACNLHKVQIPYKPTIPAAFICCFPYDIFKWQTWFHLFRTVTDA